MIPDEIVQAEAIEENARDRIGRTKKACTTAEDMSGKTCRCPYACRNFWLRHEGMEAQ